MSQQYPSQPPKYPPPISTTRPEYSGGMPQPTQIGTVLAPPQQIQQYTMDGRTFSSLQEMQNYLQQRYPNAVIAPELSNGQPTGKFNITTHEMVENKDFTSIVNAINAMNTTDPKQLMAIEGVTGVTRIGDKLNIDTIYGPITSTVSTKTVTTTAPPSPEQVSILNAVKAMNTTDPSQLMAIEGVTGVRTEGDKQIIDTIGGGTITQTVTTKSTSTTALVSVGNILNIPSPVAGITAGIDALTGGSLTKLQKEIDDAYNNLMGGTKQVVTNVETTLQSHGLFPSDKELEQMQTNIKSAFNLLSTKTMEAESFLLPKVEKEEEKAIDIMGHVAYEAAKPVYLLTTGKIPEYDPTRGEYAGKIGLLTAGALAIPPLAAEFIPLVTASEIAGYGVFSAGISEIGKYGTTGKLLTPEELLASIIQGEAIATVLTPASRILSYGALKTGIKLGEVVGGEEGAIKAFNFINSFVGRGAVGAGVNVLLTLPFTREPSVLEEQAVIGGTVGAFGPPVIGYFKNLIGVKLGLYEPTEGNYLIGKEGEPVAAYRSKNPLLTEIGGEKPTLKVNIIGDVTREPIPEYSDFVKEYVGEDTYMAHATTSKELKLDVGESVLLKGSPVGSAGPSRVELDSLHTYYAPTAAEEAALKGEVYAYGGYLGVGSGYSDVPNIKLLPSDSTILFTESEISRIPKGMDIYETMFNIGESSGKAMAPIENLIGITSERQVITPAAFESPTFGPEIKYPGTIMTGTEKLKTLSIQELPTGKIPFTDIEFKDIPIVRELLSDYKFINLRVGEISPVSEYTDIVTGEITKPSKTTPYSDIVESKTGFSVRSTFVNPIISLIESKTSSPAVSKYNEQISRTVSSPSISKTSSYSSLVSSIVSSTPSSASKSLSKSISKVSEGSDPFSSFMSSIVSKSPSKVSSKISETIESTPSETSSIVSSNISSEVSSFISSYYDTSKSYSKISSTFDSSKPKSKKLLQKYKKSLQARPINYDPLGLFTTPKKGKNKNPFFKQLRGLF